MTAISTYQAKRGDLSTVIQSWDRAGLGVLTGNAGIYRLAHVWIVLLIASGYKVHVIDCAIRFNVYRVIDEAVVLGVNLDEFLNAGNVRRAFTPYQILDVCREILDIEYSSNVVYFILAPSKQFFDGDVQDQEGYFLLNKLISVFEKIQAKRIPFVAVESRKYRHKTFQLLFPVLCDLANTTWEYDTLNFGKEVMQRFEVSCRNPMFGKTQYRLEILGGENGKNGDALF